MRTWAFIPVKAPQDCKTRLSLTLTAQQRQDLVAEMLHRTYTAVCGTKGVDRVVVLGPSRHSLPMDAPLLDDPEEGLNGALEKARAVAQAEGVSRLLFLSADLPLITSEDVAALIEQPDISIAAAPDRHGQGTNALFLPLPQANCFRFQFGDGSFAAHRAEAAQLTLPFIPVIRSGLAMDIDIPDDLKRWRRGDMQMGQF